MVIFLWEVARAGYTNVILALDITEILFKTRCVSLISLACTNLLL